MIKIFRYMKGKEWFFIGVSLVFIVLQVWLDIKVPEYMKKITDILQSGVGTSSQIWTEGGYMLGCALLSFIGAIIVGYFAASVGSSFSKRLRSELFNKVDSFSTAEINKFSTASLITRSTNDITQVQMLIVLALQLIIKAPITAVWAITKIAGQGLEWTLVTAGAVVVLTVTISLVMVFVLPKFKQIQSLTDNVNRVARENLTGLRVVRAYNAENYQQEKFEKANEDLTQVNLTTSRAMSVMFPVMITILNVVSLLIYWVGAHLIEGAPLLDKGGLFSSMVQFSSYAMQIIMSFIMLVMLFVMLPRAAVSAKRINEVLETSPTIIDGKLENGLEGIEGEVIFENVSFKYPDAAEYILKDISFKVKKGETIAFIGSTGSGKSTLISLVPRFFDVSEGRVLVDGVDVRDYKLEALNNKLGYVPQRAVLFKGSVKSNVAFGQNGKQDYAIDEVKEAVKIAQGADFVEKMEGGYDAAVAQMGANISGGQKQRIAIARAVCRKPEIYIFDDSFSALDYKTDRILRSALKKETKGVTSMIVAQRIGTIMDADQIIVLDEGRIVGKGTHRELLTTCNVYRQIAASQLSEKELQL